VILPVPLVDTLELRPLRSSDAHSLAVAYAENREHLAPWDPEREDRFFTTEHQQHLIDASLSAQERGDRLSLVLADADAVIGRLNLSGIVRGASQSGNLGYWIDHRYTGRGLITAAVAALIRTAQDELRLHRIKAGTLLHNYASQRVLLKCGFEPFGVAPRYVKIAGEWQDHKLFQVILEG
jgi:[ribosomal protein S5]-alanine N-acetyltransferase